MGAAADIGTMGSKGCYVFSVLLLTQITRPLHSIERNIILFTVYWCSVYMIIINFRHLNIRFGKTIRIEGYIAFSVLIKGLQLTVGL